VGSNYDIILIGLVAVFLILRLRSVLGKRTGNERPPAADPFERPKPPPAPTRAGEPGGNDNVIPLPSANPNPKPMGTTGPGAIRATVMPTAAAGVSAIRAADPSFDPMGFAGGARAAFTTIVEAFARGDTKTLRPLLDDRTYASFEGAIRAREANKEKAETTLIGFEASDIAAAELEGSHAAVTVRFVSEQINVVRNAEGQVADGNPNEVQKVIDLWTFRRDTKSSDPNWLLIKTESEG
jgi:predicted lipid-binding transport protein (Tim44 family)